MLGDHPEIERQLSQVAEWILETISGAWQHAGAVAGAVVLSLFVVALVLYLVIDPRTLLRVYMDLHPVYLLLMTLAMAFAFGVLVASPVAGFLAGGGDDGP